MNEMETLESQGMLVCGGQISLASVAQRSVVGRVGQPLNVGVDHAVGMVFDAVGTHGLAVHKAKQICALPTSTNAHSLHMQ